MMQATLVGRGLFRLPFGLAVRANDWIQRVSDYSYRGTSFDVVFEGAGDDVARLAVDGRAVPATLQLPDEMLNGARTVTVALGGAPARPRLARSTVRLLSVDETEECVTYRCRAFGHNQLGFQGNPGVVELVDEQGHVEELSVAPGEGLHWVIFPGRGVYKLRIGCD
jgi:hypothetical protein